MSAERCPACKRAGCHCPVCNGTGRSRGRGYSTPCHHCVSVYVTRLEAENAALRAVVAAWRELAEWESANVFHEVHWDASRVFAIADDADGISVEVAESLIPAGEVDHGRHAVDLARQLKLIPESEGAGK